jgi:hypothetical protein
MDFSGAERLEVGRIDYEKESQPKDVKEISDASSITRIIELLASLPKEGTMMAKMGPVAVHSITAYKGTTPFAKIEFYGSMLKTENTAFFGLGPDDPISRREAELFSLIEIK